MDRTLSTIQHIIQRSRERKALPLAPTEADNCYLSGRSNEYQDMSQLTAQQRYTIAQLLKQGKTQKEIALTIEKDKSVVSREIKRNSNKDGTYTATGAQMKADKRKRRLRSYRTFTSEMERIIKLFLTKHQWSPEQIVGHCKNKDIPMVSVERIYQFIREDKECDGSLYKHCRHNLKHRKRPVGKNSGPIKDRVFIDDRPKEANGERFGDWELDLIVGPNNQGAMVTLVERNTLMTLIRKLPNGKKAEDVANAVFSMLAPYRRHNAVLTITTDNGSEFALHKEIAKALNVDIYFAHPYCSWEKGCIENTNKLIRQYFKKKVAFDNYSTEEVRRVQKLLNNRPRKKLNFLTPGQLFYQKLDETNSVAFDS